VTKVPPKIEVCEKQYVFDATPLVEGVPFKRFTAKCPAYDVPSRLEQLVAKKQRKDDEKFQQIVARADAREERKKRWEEKQTQIAEALGGGNADTETAEATEASAGTETASTEAGTPEQKQSGQVFALQAKPKESRTAGFFKRWVPFGNKAEDNESTVGPIDTTIVPAAKP
jgi:hypothetical protein